ncbi:site-specific DNA-methyltransferase [Desulfobaculum bizertense]|uniref:site-specific DNA-methyltransferase (adenine-specific) n=1 Tax=Desulfobaculum bizertense DSM 18034 TaxID=1121442 RepID=A0A1T4X5I2_9BACT|nr:site-specific DNA-methyltransferase [Desulfobaculum bizertense]SKA84141.1 DNA modification methylase [Desulfobaculum bizertense DSM 18034]
MEKLTIEAWPVARLRSYTRQLRKNDKNIERMIACIQEFGFRVPILARPDGEVIDGDLRLKAAQKMGLESVPVIPAEGMSEEQVRAFRILANSSVAWSTWDDEVLAQELRDLWDADFNLELTGLELSEVEDLLQSIEPESQEQGDAVPETQAEPVVKPGDLWRLGEHFLFCGDSTKAESYEQLMQGREADMIWTDPPYNVDYEGTAGKIKNDSMSDSAFREFLERAFAGMFGAMKKGGAAYVAHADSEGVNFREAFRKAGFRFSNCLIWRKNVFVLGRADYQCQHEPILYGWKPGAAHSWLGGRKRRSVQELSELGAVKVAPDGTVSLFLNDRALHISGQNLEVQDLESSLVFEDKPQRSELHPTMKPVALVERFLKNSSRKGEVVLDPFGGSGTTLIACERTRRACRTIELDTKFADVIIRRWQEHTGKDAVLQSTGERFAMLEAANG